MSYQLTFGGGETLLVRDKGTANAVQGFVSNEIVVSKNNTALPTTFEFELLEYIQLAIVTPTTTTTSTTTTTTTAPPPSNIATITWRKDAGVWKRTLTFVKVTGTWKNNKPFVKISGFWN